MLDRAPASGGPLLSETGRNILLLHAHDETEALLPRYYEKFLRFAAELGVVFDEPKFDQM